MPFLVETHFHTAETSPCGQVRAADGIALYARNGYQAVVVTDHFQAGWFEKQKEPSWHTRVERWLTGWRLANSAGRALGVKVLLGMEYTFPGTADDVLVYGLSEERILANPDMHRLGPAGLARLARDEKLVLIQAHPFRPYVSRVYDELVDGLEVYNGNPRHHSDNAKAARLAKAKEWMALSGSDFHREEDVARGGILLPELPEDPQTFAEMLRAIRTPVLITG